MSSPQATLAVLASSCALLAGCPSAPSDTQTTATPPQPSPAPSPAGTAPETSATAEPSATAMASASASADASASATAASDMRWADRWSSVSCGKRTYVRWITLKPNGTANGIEKVSPCPTGARCAWSGLINWSGTWKADGDTVTINAKANNSGPGNFELPTTLTWNAAAKAPAEGDCVYKPRRFKKPRPDWNKTGPF